MRKWAAVLLGFAALGSTAGAARRCTPRPPRRIAADLPPATDLPTTHAPLEAGAPAAADADATDADADAARARCAEIALHARARLEVLADGGGTISDYVTGLLGRCLVTPHGAWTFDVSDVAPGDGYASLALHVVHLDAAGHASALPAATQEEGADAKVHNCCSVYGVTEIAARIASDYDGDGEPELYLASVQTGSEGHHVEAHSMYTARGGAVAHIEAAERLGFVDLRDADGDGLLDLVLAPFVASEEGPCTGFPMNRTIGPRLLGHALGGGAFSTADDVARTAARAACPQRPSRFDSPDDVACARVWGVRASALGAAFEQAAAACRTKHDAPPADAACDVEDPCRTSDLLVAFARVTPPTVLAP